MIKTLKKIYLLRKYNVKLKFKLKYAEITKLSGVDEIKDGIRIRVKREALYVRNSPVICGERADTIYIRGKRTELGI